MTQPKKILRIKNLRDIVAGEVEVERPDGSVEKHNVLQMDFDAHQALAAAEGSAESITVLREIVQKVVPTLAAETVGTFNPDTAQAILTLSGAGIDAVEKLFPNAVSPEPPTSPG